MNENFKINYSAIGIIRNVVLYLSMAFSCIAVSEEAYNLLPFYDLGVEVSFSGFQYYFPFVMALIYYGLYTIYIKMIFNSANGRMSMYGKCLSKENVRALVDPCFILLAVLIGIVEIIFYIYPVWGKMFKTICKEICAFIVIYLMYRQLSRGLEKIYKPIIFKALLMPSILLVVLIWEKDG